jgi:ElaB/YqjD/DUF883 family membrane-anchored ribosome-binding protein
MRAEQTRSAFEGLTEAWRLTRERINNASISLSPTPTSEPLTVEAQVAAQRTGELAELLAELAALLAKHSLRAGDVLNELKERAKGSPWSGDITALEGSVMALDYAAAATQVAKLRATAPFVSAGGTS